MKRWSLTSIRVVVSQQKDRDHVATDGSLLAVAGKWSACGWSVVQHDHTTRRWGPVDGMYGTRDVELEVQRAPSRGRH